MTVTKVNIKTNQTDMEDQTNLNNKGMFGKDCYDKNVLGMKLRRNCSAKC